MIDVERGAFVFASETVNAETWEESQHLIRANHNETGVLRGVRFSPSLERYQAMQNAGMVRVYTVREDGKMVGYAVFFLIENLHYGELWGLQDAMYVSRSCRGTMPVRFILWAELQLKGEGAKIILRHVSSKHDYSRTLLGLGYEKLEESYIKRLS